MREQFPRFMIDLCSDLMEDTFNVLYPEYKREPKMKITKSKTSSKKKRRKVKNAKP